MLRWALSLEAFVCAVSDIGTPEPPVVLELAIVTLSCLPSIFRHVLSACLLRNCLICSRLESGWQLSSIQNEQLNNKNTSVKQKPIWFAQGGLYLLSKESEVLSVLGPHSQGLLGQ